MVLIGFFCVVFFSGERGGVMEGWREGKEQAWNCYNSKALSHSFMAKHTHSCFLPSLILAQVLHGINFRKRLSLPQSYFTNITLPIWHK